MPTLMALAGWEEAILASLKGTTGSIEEKDAQVRLSGLYAEYPTVLRCYLDHLADESTRAEALKRAIFLIWISSVEPPPFSGIAELPESDTRAAMHALEAEARQGRLDAEFTRMLAWYHSILALPFELLGADHFVPEALRDVAPDAWRDEFQAAQFEGRGQLGHYWRAMLHTQSD
jgi:hypothetical protein